MNYPCTELFISPILLVNILSISVADVAETLEGRVISGKKPLLDINILGSLCMAFIVQNINVIISKQVTGFIYPFYYIYNVTHLIIKGGYILIWWTIITPIITLCFFS